MLNNAFKEEGASSLEKDAYIGLVEATEKLEQLEVDLKDKLVDVERSYPAVRVIVGNYEYKIEPEYFDDETVTIRALVDAYMDGLEEMRVEEYLRRKYDGFNGVPYSQLEHELQDMKPHQISNWIKVLYDRPIKDKKKIYVHFAEVAAMVVFLSRDKEERDGL